MNAPLIAPVHTVDLVLRLARSYLWVREHGNNKGEAVAEFLQVTGLGEGYPWCAAFVAKIGRDAFGKDWPLPPVAGCASLGDAAARKEMLYKVPAPGAVFLLYSPTKKRFHHTGFVDHSTTNGWATIEGNTNEDGSAEGIGVFERERDFEERDRFIYWWRQ